MRSRRKHSCSQSRHVVKDYEDLSRIGDDVPVRHNDAGGVYNEPRTLYLNLRNRYLAGGICLIAGLGMFDDGKIYNGRLQGGDEIGGGLGPFFRRRGRGQYDNDSG
jgi:hypothetical protein